MYLKYFGFREFPFSITPDPKFFFDGPLHREAWASLFYGIKEKKGFVVVTGEVGTGKTTLLRKALRSLDATYHSVFIFNTLLTFDELLETILRDLDLDPAGMGRVAMLERLNNFLLEKVKIGHVVSVLIDEAQNLSEDALEGVRLLSNMETDREKLLQIILVGQPELDVKLHSRSLRQLKQRVALWCRLDSLSLSDTEAYIRHRLQVAQYQGPDIFPASTIRSIWEYTSGIPRLLNAVCDNALLTAYATSNKIVSVDIVREVVSDLRLQPENQRLGLVAPEQEDLPQPARARAGGGKDLCEDIAPRGSRSAEDQEPLRLARGTGAPVVADFMPKRQVREPQGDEIVALESRESNRPQARTAASVGERKDKKSTESGRVVDIAEMPRAARPVSAKPERIVGPARKVDDSRDHAILSGEFLNKMVAALTDAMGPMAPLVLRGQAAALGESLERFPVTKLRDLVQALKREILSVALRGAFEEQIAKEIARHAISSGWR